MGLLDWLFGQATNAMRVDSEVQWSLSEGGNPTTNYGGRRLTVFESDGGWKFCDAKLGNDNDPYFSEVYETMAAAKHEALAWIDGRQPGYQSRSEVNRDRRRNRWEAVIEEKIALSDGIKKSLVQSDLNVTQLRKLEAKVSSQVRQLSWQTSELYSAAVSDSTIATAERLKKDFDFLAERIATRIAERKTHSTKKPTR